MEAQFRPAGRRSGGTGVGNLFKAADRDHLATSEFRAALRTACIQAAAWSGGEAERQICITLPRCQLCDNALSDIVVEALQASELRPDRLVLGIAEPVLARVDSDAMLTLSALRDLGVGLEVDEFGAEEGNLSLLRRLPLTGLKLARDLVRCIPACGEDAALVQAMMSAAAAFSLITVADGVKTEEQRAFLACCGCDEGQGSLFGRPMPSSAAR